MKSNSTAGAKGVTYYHFLGIFYKNFFLIIRFACWIFDGLELIMRSSVWLHLKNSIFSLQVTEYEKLYLQICCSGLKTFVSKFRLEWSSNPIPTILKVTTSLLGFGRYSQRMTFYIDKIKLIYTECDLKGALYWLELQIRFFLNFSTLKK